MQLNSLQKYNQIFAESSTLDDAVYHVKFTGFEYLTTSEFSAPVFEPFEVFCSAKTMKNKESLPGR